MTELARNTLRVVSLTLCLALSACAHFQQRTASQILADRQYSWIGDSTAHTRIHYLAGSPAADSLPRLRRDLESAWVIASDFVGDATQQRAIDVFAVPRREMVGAVAGMSITTNALNFWETRVVVAWVPARGWPGPHEFVHIMAYDAWGPAKEWWLGEGTAVAAGPWLGVDVDMYAKCLSVAGKLLPLDHIVPRVQGDPLDEHLAQVTYPEAGSFMRFLIREYGREKVARLYAKGASEIPAVYGQSLSDLEMGWRRHLESVDATGISCRLR